MNCAALQRRKFISRGILAKTHVSYSEPDSRHTYSEKRQDEWSPTCRICLIQHGILFYGQLTFSKQKKQPEHRQPGLAFLWWKAWHFVITGCDIYCITVMWWAAVTLCNTHTHAHTYTCSYIFTTYDLQWYWQNIENIETDVLDSGGSTCMKTPLQSHSQSTPELR